LNANFLKTRLGILRSIRSDNDYWYFSENPLMIRACLCLLAGVYALQLSSFAAPSDLTVVAFFALFAFSALRRWHSLSWVALGLALFSLASAGIIDSRLSPVYVGDSMVTQVRVISFPENTGSSVTMIVEPLGDHRLPPRIRISWFEPSVPVRFGDIWQFELRLRRPRGSRNAGVFDYEAWLFRNRIGATGYVVDGRRNYRIRSDAHGVIDRIRQRSVDRLTELLPLTPDAAVLAAISVGARHLITRQQWDRYARTGTSHLMAISGLHIGLAAGAAYVVACFLGGLLVRHGNHHARATVVAIAVAGLYSLVSGLALPAQRASVMIGLLGIAVLRRRLPRPLLIIVAACLALAALSPVETMAPGFKLSFAAVLLLVWIARRHQRTRRKPWSWRLVSSIRSLAVVQVLLLLGLLPLTVLIFSRVAFAAPLVNLIAVPLFSVVTVPFTLFGLLLDGPFRMIGDQALLIAALSLNVIENLIDLTMSVRGSGYQLPDIRGLAWVYLLLPLLWVVLPTAWPGRTLAWLGVIALMLHQPPRPATGCVAVDVLDVGQGLAVVVRTGEYVLLYDTGPAFRSGSSSADIVVLPYLAGLGLRRIDTLVVSHSDLDHAGGADVIMSGIEVGAVLTGEYLPGLSSKLCSRGQQWRTNGVDFRIIYPTPEVRHTGNDASCVLEIETGLHRLLVTGDIERQAEEELIRSDALQPVVAVVVPHHGSQTSSTGTFTRSLSPTWAIVSAGYGNRWGFPKQQVIERWQKAGATVLDTASGGAITIRMCASGGIEPPVQHRLEHRRIWHE
jgi:competence protein ComEC